MQTISNEQIHLEKLNYLLAEVWERNHFYTHKWCQAGVGVHQLSSSAELAEYPFTTRAELLADQAATPPRGTNLSQPFVTFKRFFRSSGTTRAPLHWADTAKSWYWVLSCSQRLWLMAGVEPADRVFFLMNFGLASGPWIISEGARRLGCACFTGGEMEPREQLRWLDAFEPTVLVGKPSRLLSLVAALRSAGLAPQRLGVRKLILTGENATQLRTQLQDHWSAECFDRYGLTEAGSVAGECPAHTGLHVLDDEFVAEVIDPATGAPVADGELGELVLTTLGRLAQPIVRYRTGDLVRLVWDHSCQCGRSTALLQGGVSRKTS